MATIVQDYGPIYGEVVNGTVQGRPNGSVYVPLSNTISLSIPASPTITKNNATLPNFVYMSPGKQYTIVAQAQDLSSYVGICVYTDSACTTKYGDYRYFNAGQFNFDGYNVGIDSNSTQPVTGQSYWVRAELFNNGVAVATSAAIEVLGA